jgi:hypothetical protein
MSIFRHVGICFLLLASACLSQSCPAFSQSAPAALQSSQLRDDQCDFDFDFGTWKTHTSRLQHPLTGSTARTSANGAKTRGTNWINTYTRVPSTNDEKDGSGQDR